MPLPVPKNKEKKTDFVSRCVGDNQTGKDFPDQKQRIATCYSLWEKAKKNAQVVAGEGDMEFLYSSSKITGSEEETAEEELMDLKEDLSEMVIGSISAIKNNAENILNNLSNGSVVENLSEPFLQQMAALAEDYVSTIHNYVMFSSEPPEEMEEVDAAKRKGLWDNIREKKKKMGKNYKPAQPGSKDKPDQESWEKAQK